MAKFGSKRGRKWGKWLQIDNKIQIEVKCRNVNRNFIEAV